MSDVFEPKFLYILSLVYLDFTMPKLVVVVSQHPHGDNSHVSGFSNGDVSTILDFSFGDSVFGIALDMKETVIEIGKVYVHLAKEFDEYFKDGSESLDGACPMCKKGIFSLRNSERTVGRMFKLRMHRDFLFEEFGTDRWSHVQIKNALLYQSLAT